MKYYIIAGEASGDLHGSNLIKELKKLDSEAQIRCWGGDLMQAQGGDLQKHYRDLAFMGFIEVAMNLRTILKNQAFCEKDILEFQPDAIILIDYPGFNMRIAKWAHERGIKVIYYISPQVWAWHKSRVKSMRKYIDKLIVILPFEKEFFKEHGIDAEYVGHPLLDAMAADTSGVLTFEDKRPVIAMLPGSRKQELKAIFPVMLSVVDDFPEYQFVIAGTEINRDLYAKYIQNKNVKIVYGQTYALLRASTAALVKSGTSTLEAALLEVPEVLCYKGSYISYIIAKNLIKHIRFIGIVNLIMDRSVMPELIQTDLKKELLTAMLKNILGSDGVVQKQDYKLLKEKLGGEGASFRAANTIIRFLKRY